MERNQVKTNNENNYQDAAQCRVKRRVRLNGKQELTYRGKLAQAIQQFRELRAQITTEGAQKAWRIANEMLDDISTPARTRWDIARTFLLMAGHVPPRPVAPEAVNDRPLVERSTADLRALVDQLEGELAGRAVPISAPAERPLASQAVDMWS